MTVYNVNGMDSAQVAQADEDRTKRLFVGFLTSALGVDQTYNGADQVIASAPDQYVIANPNGSYSVLGRSQSNLQSPAASVAGLSPLVLLGGLFLLFTLAK